MQFLADVTSNLLAHSVEKERLASLSTEEQGHGAAMPASSAAAGAAEQPPLPEFLSPEKLKEVSCSLVSISYPGA